MADIDDELLALAGDASSDEEDSGAVDTSRRSSMSGKGLGGGKASGRKSGRRQNDSEEEGEASSGHSSPGSRHSAPMVESDSESDAGPVFDDDGEKYPLEGKFMNAADKADILAMPEIKREELLAERAQEVERERQSRALRQLLNAREAENKKHINKRKAKDADLDDSQRKTSRQRTKLGGGKVGEASTGIDSLKRARAEKNDRQRRRDEDNERRKDRRDVLNDFSDPDADADSEVEWDDGKHKKSLSPDFKDAEPASLQDIQHIRMGRARFGEVCFYPGFDEAIVGCFARIVVGEDKQTGQNIYRMAIIKGFVEDKPYALETPNGKTFKTTQYARCAHGKAERNWPFITCSNSPFTESEWNRYKQTCLIENVPLPTKPRLGQKLNDINSLIHRSWTEAELQEKLTKSGALVSKYTPIERNRLNNLIKEAKSTGNIEREETFRKELAALEGPKLAYNTSMQSSPHKPLTPAGLSQQERLALLNRQNRKKNAEEVRQAQINERRAAKLAEAAIARGEIINEDHSRRVKTRAKFKHDVAHSFDDKKAEGESGASTPAVGTPTLSAKKISTPIPHAAKLQATNGEKKGLPTIRRPLMDDDIIGAIDLGIDIEI